MNAKEDWELLGSSVTTPVHNTQRKELHLLPGGLITPIYPVRYAYANFFGDRLEAAAAPPPLSQMLGRSAVSQTRGYVARVLRPGWIYIREEDGPGGGHFHIFKYAHHVNGEQLEERFPKYQFANGVDARGGLVEDTSSGRAGGYPFVFVRKDVTRIRIAYSEHQWHPEVIERMHGNASERAAAMQLVVLDGDDPATVPASAENLAALVEDYRTQQTRVLQLHASDAAPEVRTLALDILTTQDSYQMDSAQIAEALRRRARPGETPRILALHDPVGRQRDIAEVHAKLALWEKEYASTNVYPFTIGQLVERLRQSPSSEVRDILTKSIHWGEHLQYWRRGMEADLRTFQTRQQQFAELYQAFMSGAAHGGEPGSLATYFSKFFCLKPESPTDAAQEFTKLCQLSAGLFNGIIASQPGRAVMEELSAQMEQRNAAYAITKALATLATTPQTSFQWSAAAIEAADDLLRQLGPLWGDACAWAAYSGRLGMRAANRLTANSVQYIVDDFIPALLRVFGLEIKPGGGVRLSHDALARVLASSLRHNVRSYPLSPGGQGVAAVVAERSLQGFTRLFDWGERVRNDNLPQLWTLAEVKVTRVIGARYHLADFGNGAQRVGIMLEGSLGGLSAFFNVNTITSVLNQSRFEEADPITRGSRISSALQLVSALSALTVDTLSVARSVSAAGSFVLNRQSAALAKALAPRLENHAGKLGRLLAGRLVSGLVAVANLAAALDAITMGIEAWNDNNRPALVGSAMVGVGLTVLFGYAAAAFFGSAVTGPGVVAGTIAALLLTAVGTVTVALSAKSHFERMLENCFWGKGEKYLFWDPKAKRRGIEDRVRLARSLGTNKSVANWYQTELQEFMNYLNMPALEKSDDSTFFTAARIHTLVFTLPNFQPGVSELHCAVHSWRSTARGSRARLDSALTTRLREAIGQAALTQAEGFTRITVSLPASGRIRLHWYYEPQPGLYAPLRHLASNGLQPRPLLGMIDDRLP